MILMQFTGLHDKNGKEIYEGDLIELDIEDGLNKFGIVKFEDGCFGVNSRAATLAYLTACGSKIIGNIHENPELLEILEWVREQKNAHPRLDSTKQNKE